MKAYNRWVVATIALFALIIIGVNAFVIKEKDNGRPYLVEINRAVNEIQTGKETDLTQYKYIKKVKLCSDNEELTASSGYDYCIKDIAGKLYRFEYITGDEYYNNMLIIVNTVMVLAMLLVVIILFVIKAKVIKPFHTLESVPYELSRGNLNIPLDESKSRLFGKYIWGTNMLRENIEERRREELELHKEKKTVLLSLAHDIKTPLSVIKLNAQAIEKGLYKEEGSNEEMARSIIGKVDEIGSYVNKIMEATKDDFLKLEVIEGELYLSELMNRVKKYYDDKLRQLKINFVIEDYSPCILAGDIDRLEEVIQNLVENGIKYGDGDEIRISFSIEEECQLICVSNTGNTLPAEEAAHIFESFYRGSNVGSKPGSGLGLYICRQLMTQMKGDIFLHPEGDLFRATIVVPMV